MDYRWTKTGVNIEVTNTVNGMLEQGGVCGRVEHYSEEQVRSMGYTRTDDLNQPADGEFAPRIQMIRCNNQPRTLRKGVKIQ